MLKIKNYLSTILTRITSKKGPPDMLESVTLVPIGTIRSEHTVASETPVQPPFARGCRGRVEILPEYEKGLQDIDGFSHVILIYHLHQSPPPALIAKPFLDDTPRGIFATRAPWRPNPIGLSVVRLVKREGAVLFLDSVDILDGTPLLDVKPFVARFDLPESSRSGWIEQVDRETAWRRGRRGYRATHDAKSMVGDARP